MSRFISTTKEPKGSGRPELSLTTLSITTLIINALFETFSITTLGIKTLLNVIKLSVAFYLLSCECRHC
jgi:hypothetical protein